MQFNTQAKISKVLQKFYQLKGTILGNSVKVFWYKGVPNFGDLLTPELFAYYGFTPVYTPHNKAQILSVGSILDNVEENFSGMIFGSGLMYDRTKSFPEANIIAVRGKLTKERINAPDAVILGDPGLLIDRLLRKRQNKKYTLGIILHYADKGDERIGQIYQRNQKEILMIDVQQNPKVVIRSIDKCEYILSSSLHGIIAADSLGIPNAWIYLSDKVLGNGFKFHDYYSSFNMDFEPPFIKGLEHVADLIKLTHQVSSEIGAIKINLQEAFSNLKKRSVEFKVKFDNVS